MKQKISWNWHFRKIFGPIVWKKMVEKNNYPWRSVSGANEARSQLSILPNSKCPRFFGCKTCWMVGTSTEAARKASRTLQGPILRQALIKALALFQMTVLSLLASKGFVTIFGAATTFKTTNWGQTASTTASAWCITLAPTLQAGPHLKENKHMGVIRLKTEINRKGMFIPASTNLSFLFL